MTTDRESLLSLADQAGTLSGALSNIADQVHTMLTVLDQARPYTGTPIMAGLVSGLRGQLETLGEYVEDVQARTAPAPSMEDR